MIRKRLVSSCLLASASIQCSTLQGWSGALYCCHQCMRKMVSDVGYAAASIHPLCSQNILRVSLVSIQLPARIWRMAHMWSILIVCPKTKAELCIRLAQSLPILWMLIQSIKQSTGQMYASPVYLWVLTSTYLTHWASPACSSRWHPHRKPPQLQRNLMHMLE